MTGGTVHALLVEDNHGVARFVQEALKRMSNPPYELQRVEQISAALSRLADGGIDVLLLDVDLPDSQGLASLLRIRAIAPDLPIVVLSTEVNPEHAVAALRSGAQEYLVKNHASQDSLIRSLRYSIERKSAQKPGELAQRLTYHVENSPLAAIELGPDMHIVRWSHEAESTFGWKAEEVVGKAWHDFRWVCDEDLDMVSKVATALESGVTGGRFSANRNYRKDGAVIHCEWYNSVLLDDLGNLRSALLLGLDVTDRKRAEEALGEANCRLRQLSADLLRSQDFERRRIARDLHDGTAQLLTALSMDLNLLRDSDLEPERKHEVLSESIDLAAACFKEIRAVTYLLHPPLLDRGGLVSALQAFAEGFHERTGVQIDLEIPPDFCRLYSALEVALFRIVQEGLSNVHRHSGSPQVLIRLEIDSAEVRLVVQDRGCGLPSPLNGQNGFIQFGVGIPGMRERAEQLGGSLEVISPGTGTRISACFPLTPHEEIAHIGS